MRWASSTVPLCNSVFPSGSSGRGESWVPGACCSCRARRVRPCRHLLSEGGVGRLQGSPQTPSPSSGRYFTSALFMIQRWWCTVSLLVVTMWLCPVIQADNHQDNLVVADAKKLDADGLVNFISVNEIGYITEYNQMVGPPCLHHWNALHGVNSFWLSSCPIFYQSLTSYQNMLWGQMKTDTNSLSPLTQTWVRTNWIWLTAPFPC